jgi:hypothetical protein
VHQPENINVITMMHGSNMDKICIFISSFFYDPASISGRTGKSSTVKDLDGNNYDLV